MERLIARYIAALQSYSKRYVLLFILLATLSIGSIVVGIGILNNKVLVSKPVFGGEVIEGVTGSPYAINPVLAASQTDKDLVSLIFSGLTREYKNEVINDLAKEHVVSNDGLTYTFTLKDGVTFHDGSPVTAHDVVYTVEKIQDPTLRSPNRIKWEGVEVRAIDDKTVQFILKKPFADFLKNTSVGIIPKKLFENNPNEAFGVVSFNTEPIGSGPFKIKSVKRENGIPIEYTLVRNENFAITIPFLEKIIVKVFDSEEALANALLNKKVTNASSLSSVYAHTFIEGGNLEARRAPLPRVYGLFLNQNKSKPLQDIVVRKSLNESIDRALMTYETFYGFGTPLSSAAPLEYRGSKMPVQTPKEDILKTLSESGWTKNETGILAKDGVTLSFTIATIDIPELKKIAQFIQNSWKDLGVEVFVESYSLGDLRDVVVAGRSFDILLYGIVVDEDADLYTYWHSSGRSHPGLNVSQYTNNRVDTALELIKNGEATKEDVSSVLSRIESDIPAIFLFSPDFVYITEKKLQGVSLYHVRSAENRFSDVYLWYKNTEKVWPIVMKIPYLQKIESFIYSI